MKYTNFETNEVDRFDKSELKKLLREVAKYVSVFIIVVAVPLFVVYRAGRGYHDEMRMQFVEDFDYILATLERNFPLFELIYQRHGVDMPELGRQLRDYLAYEADNPSARSFVRLVRNDFFRVAGHMGNLELMNFVDVEVEMSLQGSFWFGNQRRIDSFREILYPPNEHPVLWEIPMTREITVVTREQAWWNPADINTEIIEEGRIGYIKIGLLPIVQNHREVSLVNAFFGAVRDFDHLIIDIRGLEGRNSAFFHRVITGPLMSSPEEVEFHHFFMNGRHNQLYFSDLHYTMTDIDEVDFGELFGEDAILRESLERMDYYFSERVLSHSLTGRVNFNGKIWFLIDGATRQGGQQIASFYENLGFATFVGETTGGGFGSPSVWGSNFFVLPNTGFVVRYNPTLIIDSRGRPLELGTKPHFFNFPGMDALETVLELINRGSY